MPEEQQPEPYKIIRVNMLLKVCEGELPQQPGSDEYHYELLRLVLSNLFAEMHNAALAPQQPTEEIARQETPDISQRMVPNITPPAFMGEDEARFVLFPGAVVVGSREWSATAVQALEHQLLSGLAEQDAPRENVGGEDNVLAFTPPPESEG